MVGERPGLPAAQVLRAGARADRPVRVHVLEVDDQHVRPKAGQDPGHRGQGTVRQFVVPVDEPDVLPRRLLGAQVPGGPGTGRGRRGQHPKPRVLPGGQDRAAAVGGRVVDGDHLERGHGPAAVGGQATPAAGGGHASRAEHRVQAAVQVVLDPVHRDDDADQRHGTERYRPAVPDRADHVGERAPPAGGQGLTGGARSRAPPGEPRRAGHRKEPSG